MSKVREKEIKDCFDGFFAKKRTSKCSKKLVCDLCKANVFHKYGQATNLDTDMKKYNELLKSITGGNVRYHMEGLKYWK